MDNFINLNFQRKRLIKAISKINEFDKIKSALLLAQRAHKGQKRDEGQNYLIHPIRVANCLIYEIETVDPCMIIAALLHDVVEDSNISLIQIRKRFGDCVADFVNKLTRDKSNETKSDKLLSTLRQSKTLRLLKSLDWLDNSRSLLYRQDRGERYWRHLHEVSNLYVVLAKSVNHNIAREMRDIVKKLANK